MMRIPSSMLILLAAPAVWALQKGTDSGFSTIGVSSQLLTQAADVAYQNFHTSVINTFAVSGMNNQAIDSQPHCLVTYPQVILQTFSSSGIAMEVVASSTPSHGNVLVHVKSPNFVIDPTPFDVVCTFPTPMGIISQSAQGTVTASWSSTTPLTTQLSLQIVDGNVTVGDAQLLTPISTNFAYTYTVPKVNAFVYDIFMHHHFFDGVKPAIDNAIMNMFQSTGAPVNLLSSFLNDVLSSWNEACSTAQVPPSFPNVPHPWLFINEQPACSVVNLTALPPQNWMQVTKTPTMHEARSHVDVKCHPSHTQEHFIKIPGYGESLKLLFSNCTHCSTSDGEVVGVSCDTSFEGTMPPL